MAYALRNSRSSNCVAAALLAWLSLAQMIVTHQLSASLWLCHLCQATVVRSISAHLKASYYHDCNDLPFGKGGYTLISAAYTRYITLYVSTMHLQKQVLNKVCPPICLTGKLALARRTLMYTDHHLCCSGSMFVPPSCITACTLHIVQMIHKQQALKLSQPVCCFQVAISKLSELANCIHVLS